MYCMFCGKELEGNPSFCHYCGNKLVASDNTNVTGGTPVNNSEEGIFSDVGNKIKQLAMVLCFISIILGIVGFFVFVVKENGVLAFTSLIGGIFSFILYWFVYAYGQIADDVHAIKEYLLKNADNNISTAQKTNTDSAPNND